LRSGRILVDRVWKRFRADRRRTLLRDELERLRARRRGEHRGWTWALRDVSFTAEPGDSIGIVGRNGSGKTTLLRVLAGVMYPYAGRVDLSGKLGTLINMSAGLHPDLTGQENIYIQGSLIGLKRKEIARRFDEIVAFAELEDAIRRQVKFYSSGMMLRLGFSTAAFLDPDILLVDEVLAAGDAAFQQKCLERTRDRIMSGTTFVFVSHDLQSVEGMCRQGIWLRDGVVEAAGQVREAVGEYRGWIEKFEAHYRETLQRDGAARIVKMEVTGPEGNGCRTEEPLEIRAIVESPEGRAGTLYVGVTEGPSKPIFVLHHELSLRDGETEARCVIPHLPLPRGRFYVWVGIFGKSGQELLPWQPATEFEVYGPDLHPAPQGIVRLAPIHLQALWDTDGRQ
jgi:ABC-type polysaccharide/polyol phosphate transport system ATPase subunit